MDWTRRGILTAIAALGIAKPVMAAEKPRVVCTTGMIADAAQSIADGYVGIRALIGSGMDPHAYRQTRSDVSAMLNSDLVMWHGLSLEAQLTAFFQKLSTRKKVVAVAESLPSDLLLKHDDDHDKPDPHIWMDPTRWTVVITTITKVLAQISPRGGEIFQLRSQAYIDAIGAIDSYAQSVLETISHESRVLITAHDAFKYFGDAYGFNVMGVQGISTQTEAGLNRITELVNFIVARKIKSVFVETSVSDRNMRALIEGAASKGHSLTIGGELFSDAMGPEGSYEGTYIGMIDHNVTTIARALGGQAPLRGANGALKEISE